MSAEPEILDRLRDEVVTPDDVRAVVAEVKRLMHARKRAEATYLEAALHLAALSTICFGHASDPVAVADAAHSTVELGFSRVWRWQPERRTPRR